MTRSNHLVLSAVSLALWFGGNIATAVAQDPPRRPTTQDALADKIDLSLRIEAFDPFHPANEKSGSTAPTFAPGTAFRVVVEGRPKKEGDYTYSALYPIPEGV